MKHQFGRQILFSAGLGALGLASGQAGASGFALYEQNASGMGNAYAGVAASADDASTVFWNPAGMARLSPGKHMVLAGHSINPTTKFSNGASVAGLNRTDFGGDGGNAGHSALIPNGYFAMDINSRWNFGVGINVPFGLATEYDSNWVGRFQGIKSEIKAININPAFSWKATDQLSLGFGVNYMQGEIKLLTGVNYKGLVFGTALNPLVAVNAEGQNKVDLEGSGWGYNVGLNYVLSPATRLGFAYRSRVKQDLTGTVNFSGVPAAYGLSPVLTAATANGNVNFSVKTPDSAAFSVVHALNQQWELLGDVTWTGWGVIKSLPLKRESGVTMDTLSFNFKNTMRYSGGARYKMSDAWNLKMGLAYDESPVPNANDRSVRLPDSDRTWLTVGAKYKVSNVAAVDMGYAFIRAKNAPITNNQNAVGTARGNIDGNYKSSVNVLSIQYSHVF
jgi:long-chain fatty acid transport protein